MIFTLASAVGGRTVTEPVLNRAVLVDPAREAGIEAVRRMLDPLANAHRRHLPRLSVAGEQLPA